jgi:hypothetical protein
LEEQNPTPSDGGASTLDRIEALLSGEPQSQPVNEQQTQEPVQPEEQVEPQEGVEESVEPQVTTADLAKYLGIEADLLDLDKDGTVKLKTKVDGKEGAAKLSQLLQDHQKGVAADNRLREAAEREKAIQAREQEVQQQFAQRLQYAENLVNVAAQDLLRDFQSIDWNALEQQDAGHAALMKQKFQERQAQLRGVMHNVEQNRAQMMQRAQVERAQILQREAQKLPELIPEWKDAQTAQKEQREIRDFLTKEGFQSEEIDSFVLAHHVKVVRDAMKFAQLQSQKPAIEQQVRQAPKLVKPGQAQVNSKEQNLRNLKQAVQKSGGKKGIAEYLLASGKV